MKTTASPTGRQLRLFGLVGAFIWGGLAGLQWWKHHDAAAALLGAIALIFLVAGSVFPRGLAPLHWVMMRVGTVLGWVNTRVILILVFYLLVTPLGLVLRLFGHDPLRLKPNPRAASHWVPRPPGAKDAKRYERMY